MKEPLLVDDSLMWHLIEKLLVQTYFVYFILEEKY